MKPIALREQTAGRLVRQLNQVPGGGAGGRGAGAGGYGVVLVRCTDDEPASGSGVGAECYPGVIVRPAASLELADQVDSGAVWLTVFAGTAAAEPAVDGLYWCQLAGPVEIGDKTRPRAFGTGLPELAFEITDTLTAGSGPGVTSGAWGNLTASLQLPGAGTYLVWGYVGGGIDGAISSVHARLFNDTTGTPLEGTHVIVVSQNTAGGVTQYGTALMVGVITVTGNDVVCCQANHSGSGVVSVGSDYVGYAKLAGMAPGASGGYTGTVGE